MNCTLVQIPSASGRDPATTWIVIAVAILAIVYVTFVRPLRQKKKDKDPLQRPPSQSGLSQQRAVEREMSNLLVELSEMARQMTAQLDTRAARLELLIKEADEKIVLLKAAGTAGTAGGLPCGGNPAEASDSAAAMAALEGVIMEARAPLRAAMRETQPAMRETPPPMREPQIDPRHACVYDLADEGHPPQEIARQLDRPTGEIELILALRSETAF